MQLIIFKTIRRSDLNMKVIQGFQHELITPLNCSINMIQLMKEHLQSKDLTQEIKQFLNPILYSNNILLSVINDFIDYQLIQNSKLNLNIEQIDLNKILQQTTLLISIQAQLKKISLKMIFNCPNYKQEIQFLEDDQGRVQQIILNLLTNALKYTEKGEIILTITKIQENPKLIKIECQDTGRGIEEYKFSSIFNMDNQLNIQSRSFNKQTNFGMGLTVSNQIACELCVYEQQNQAIKVISEVGKGSTFYMTLIDLQDKNYQNNIQVIILQNKNNLQMKSTQNSSQNCNHSQILIVDDNLFNIFVLKKTLQQYGFNSNSASDGLEALKAVKNRIECKNCCPYYKMIIMDIQMPVMDGYESTQKIIGLLKKNEIPIQSCPIIGFSAYSTEQDKQRAIENGMIDYITKPLIQKDLNKILERWI
ncbi:two component system histidine kinase, putative [Ichthyophthirius multifiliis]|uniref:Two component system histidine kinase, putative n=1 Tax=Ichthyophthirius multifiliis TaxID=5932 RepID=G0R429_ICHMU|nr:two component system histidine kinase, putative [Ichthyophthirius multifiliis]EGR27776.1 two component system histidine kinase, putative [Ichthyophthirius multifiliis]|eukprot:XP_004026843.1 two component system histidine kinase, putative [Ichthyophthirius multifiliis]